MTHPPLLCYLLDNPWSFVVYSKKGIILYRLQMLRFPIFSIINRQEVHKRAQLSLTIKQPKLSFIVLYQNITSNWIPFRTIIDPYKPCRFQNAWIAYNAYPPSSAQIQLLALSVAGFCVSSPLQTLVAGRLPFYIHSVYGWHVWFCCLWISCRDFQADIHHIFVLYII